MDAIPEELLLHVFEYLDSTPPSELKSRDEPGLHLTKSTEHPLKTISCVSKQWRRLVLPLLFKTACLQLHIPWRTEWSLCPACSSTFEGLGSLEIAEAAPIDTYHFEMMSAYKQQRGNALTYGKPSTLMRWNATSRKSMTYEVPDEHSTALWAARIYHALQDFITFIGHEKLASSIRSFVLVSESMLDRGLILYPHNGEWRYPAAAALWQHLLSIIDPDRVVILAPPADIACLTSATFTTSGDNHNDNWSFDDTEFQSLELRQATPRTPRLSSPVDYSSLTHFLPETSKLAASSVLYLRDWSHAAVNEGSFLKAYGTYMFFETGAPRASSFMTCLAKTQLTDRRHLLHLSSFTYTGIFPFTNHVHFGWVLSDPRLEEIDLQFAPDPHSTILDDRERTGRADLQDCWHQLFGAYEMVAKQMSTSSMSVRKFPRLKRFICRDYRTPALREELDEIFTRLCLPCWVEWSPGHFTREAMSPLPKSDI